MQTAFEKMKTP